MLAFVENIFSGEGSITTLVTFSLTVMGAVALFMSNTARYMQATRYGIPPKAVTQATVGDSINVWVLLIRAIGFGIIVPFIFVVSVTGQQWWFVLIVFAVIFPSVYFGLSAKTLYNNVSVKKQEFKGKTYVVTKDTTWQHTLIVAAVASLAYLPLRSSVQNVFAEDGSRFAEGIWGNILFYTCAAVMVLYVLLIIYKICIGVHSVLFGGGEYMVTETDGQKYLIAMRNNQYQWILIPCELENVVTKRKGGGFYSKSYIKFSKGIFVVKDMSTVNSFIKHMKGYSVTDLGVPEDEYIDPWQDYIDDKKEEDAEKQEIIETSQNE